MKNRLIILTVILVLLIFTGCAEKQQETNKTYGTFSFQNEIILPGTPDSLFNAATGDISGWWDHSFSKNPLKFYIEPKPGGGFYEIFDSAGNGVKHAEVNYVEKGKIIRFTGPLGLSGTAVTMVTTYRFEPAGNDSALFSYEVHGAGEMNEKTPGIVEGVWEHFILDRFANYIRKGNQQADSVLTE